MGDPPRIFLPPVYLLALTLPLGVAPAQISLAMGLLLLGASLLLRRGPWTASPVDLPLAVFMAAGFLSAATSTHPVLSATGALSAWTLLPFFLAKEAARDLRTVRRLLLVLLVGTGAAAVTAVAQHLAEGTDLAASMESVGIASLLASGGRVTGFFHHHMTLAGQQSMLLVTFALAGAGGFLGGRARLLWAAPLLLLSLALVLTASRAAFAAAAVALLAGALLGSRRGGDGSLGRRLVRRPATLALATLVLGLTLGGTLLGERLSALRGETGGVSRAAMWQAALDMLRERPLLGLGEGGYRRAIGAHLDVAIYHPAHAHSTPLQLAAEFGLVGLACWIALWAAYYRHLAPRAWRLRRISDPRAPLLWAILLATAVFHLVGLVEFNAGDSEVMMLAAFLAGLPFGRAFLEQGPP